MPLIYRNGKSVKLGDIIKMGNSIGKVVGIRGALAQVDFPDTPYLVDPLNWDVELVENTVYHGHSMIEVRACTDHEFEKEKK